MISLFSTQFRQINCVSFEIVGYNAYTQLTMIQNINLLFLLNHLLAQALEINKNWQEITSCIDPFNRCSGAFKIIPLGGS